VDSSNALDVDVESAYFNDLIKSLEASLRCGTEALCIWCSLSTRSKLNK